MILLAGRVVLSVARLTHKPEVPGSIHGLTTFFVFPSADLEGQFVSYWRKNVYLVLFNRLGGLSMPRDSVVRLDTTDPPDMTIVVYRGLKPIKRWMTCDFTSLLTMFQSYQGNRRFIMNGWSSVYG